MADRKPMVLLTGASGVIGRALIDELAPDHTLVALRHRSPVEDPRVQEIRADLGREDLGLGSADIRDLVHEARLVLHCAAATNWRAKRDSIFRTNLDGTRNVLNFAERAAVPFYYMSTAFVTRPLAEAKRRDPAVEGLAAYVDSKIATEQHIRDSGYPSVILRPSIIIGNTRDGRIARFQGIHKVIGSILKDELPVLPAAPGSLIDAVPQDVVARATGRLIRGPVYEGEYWFTAGPSALRLADMVGQTVAVADELGLRVHPPRMMPTEAVERLLLPLLEDVIPRGLRLQFRVFVELMLLFQTENAIASSLPELGLGAEIEREALLATFRLGVRHWANQHGLTRLQEVVA